MLQASTIDLWLLIKYLYFNLIIIPYYYYILFWSVYIRFQSRLLPIPPTSNLSPSRTIQKAFVPAAFTKMIAAVSSGMVAAIKRWNSKPSDVDNRSGIGLSDRNRVIINHLENILIQLRSYLCLSLLLYELLTKLSVASHVRVTLQHNTTDNVLFSINQNDLLKNYC